MSVSQLSDQPLSALGLGQIARMCMAFEEQVRADQGPPITTKRVRLCTVPAEIISICA